MHRYYINNITCLGFHSDSFHGQLNSLRYSIELYNHYTLLPKMCKINLSINNKPHLYRKDIYVQVLIAFNDYSAILLIF